MNTTDRLAWIKAVKEQRDKELKDDIEMKARMTESYKSKLLALAPRIKEIIAVGQALFDANLPLGKLVSNGVFQEHSFVTNSWDHKLGFVAADGFNYRDGRVQRPKYLGIYGGGACGRDFIVNDEGRYVSMNSPNLYEFYGTDEWLSKAEHFMESFNRFEEEFYKYVDNLK